MSGAPRWKQPTSFKTQTSTLRRTSLKRVSSKQRRKADAWAEVGRQLDAAGRFRCEACDIHALPECSGRREHKHHIRTRSDGGPDTLSNCLPVGTAHHDWIHANAAKAVALGFLRRGERNHDDNG